MKKYYAVKGTTNLIFGSRAKRDEYIAANPDYHPEENHMWSSDEMRTYRNSTDIITSETGVEYPLEVAIKNNWDYLMRVVDMYGVSGYNLKSVHIQRHGSRCVVIIKGWNCSEILVGFDPARNWSEEKLMTRTVTFDGVEDGDLHADDFMVDLVRD